MNGMVMYGPCEQTFKLLLSKRMESLVSVGVTKIETLRKRTLKAVLTEIYDECDLFCLFFGAIYSAKHAPTCLARAALFRSFMTLFKFGGYSLDNTHYLHFINSFTNVYKDCLCLYHV